MQLSNDIVLRPRFKKHLAYPAEVVLSAFETARKTTKDFKISSVDGHVFIRIPKARQHFWSPQLHLEITEELPETSLLKGHFGPNPTVWTMFMFFHFVVAGLFIATGIWLYTLIALERPYVLPLVLLFSLILLWFALYAGGRLGKKTGEKEMEALYSFMKQVFKTIK